MVIFHSSVNVYQGVTMVNSPHLGIPMSGDLVDPGMAGKTSHAELGRTPHNEKILYVRTYDYVCTYVCIQ